MENMLDVLIIGGGPIGLSCALSAQQKGLRYTIIEKGALVDSLYHYPVNMTFFSTSEKLEIGGVPFVSNNNKPTRNEALEYYRRVTVSAALSIKLYEEVIAINNKEGKFEIITSKDHYIATNIIIATGFYGRPFMLNVPGENLPNVTHYYNDPHGYAFQKVLVVGANNSAVDAALETYRKGASVTMVIRDEQIGERVKYWVRPDIINRIEEGAIKAYFNSIITAIREKEVDILTPNGLITIENDWVIAMTGYQPDLTFLQKIGIELSSDEIKKPVYNENTHETNVKGIYLAGVICGGMNTHSLFIENSREHAQKIMDDITERKG
jgi:thioredoxin reductase (NADPH)